MDRITYKTLYEYVTTEIERRLPKDNSTSITQITANKQLAGGGANENQNEVINGIGDFMAVAIPPRIVWGLEVTATEPETASVNITKGSGVVYGKIKSLIDDVELIIPFDTNTPVFYINLYKDGVYAEKTQHPEKLTIAKVVRQKPGAEQIITDIKNEALDAYISSYKEYKMYGLNDIYEEETIEILRNNIGAVLSENLIGNIRLSENLKIFNAEGSMELNGTSMNMFYPNLTSAVKIDNTGIYFGRDDGVMMAKFSTTGAFLGNIAIEPNAIQSRDYIENERGFIIKDTGDAEFNDVVVRGSIYASRIRENLYIDEGITFIGDLNFDGDLGLSMGDKLSFNVDDGADTYWIYNKATDYLECWVEGLKRVEM